MPGLLAAKSGGERHIIVLDQSGDEGLFEGIKGRLDSSSASFDSKKQFGNMRFRLERVVVPADQDIDEVAKTYNDRVEKNSNEAYLILRKGILENPEPHYVAKNPSDIAVGNIERAISAEITDRRLAKANLTKESIEKYTKPVDLKT